MISIITSLIYGLSVAVALVVGSFLLWKAAKKADLDSELIFDWSILMVFFGIISGRLVFIFEHFGVYSQDIFRWIHFIRYPGISGKGVMFGALVAGLYFLKNKKVNYWVYLDILVIPFLYSLIIIQAGSVINASSNIYFIVVFLFLIPLFKKLKEADKGRKDGIFFLSFLSVFAMVYLILEYFAGDALYFRMINTKLVFNALIFIGSSVLLIKKAGYKNIIKFIKKGKNENT